MLVVSNVCFAEKTLVIPTAKIPGDAAKLASYGSNNELIVVDPAKKRVIWKTKIETNSKQLYFDFDSLKFYYLKGEQLYEQEWKANSISKVVWKLPTDVKIDGDHRDNAKHKMFDFGKSKKAGNWRLTTLQVSDDNAEFMQIYEFSGGEWTVIAKGKTDGCYPHELAGCGSEFTKYFEGKSWDTQLGYLSRLHCTGWENSLYKAFGESCTDLDEKIKLNVGKLGSLSVQVSCPTGEDPSPEFSSPLSWTGADKKTKVLIPSKHPPRSSNDDEDVGIREEPTLDICRCGELATVQQYESRLLKLYDLKTGEEVMDLKGLGVLQWMPDLKK